MATIADDAALLGLEAPKKALEIIEKILQLFASRRQGGNTKSTEKISFFDSLKSIKKVAMETNTPIMQQSGLSKADAKLLKQKCKRH